MGLDTTHDAFHGAYSSFMRLRVAVAQAAGGGYENYNFTYDDEVLPKELARGMVLFLGHSDCDGHLKPDECIEVAKMLDWAGPRIKWDGFQEYIQNQAKRFADGCRAAAAAGERLEFQ